MPATLFRPRSLLQLVVISFVLVMTPLGALLIQTMQALESVSMKSRMVTLEIVSLAKSSQSLPEIALDMEHAARQYQVLGDATLKGIFQLTEKRFTTELNNICKSELSPQFYTVCTRVEMMSKALIDTLSSAPYDSITYENTLIGFDLFTKHTQQLVQLIQQLIEQRSEQLAEDAAKAKSQLLWQSVSLVPLSIMMSILFTFFIIRPIQRLEKIIQELGSGQPLSESQVHGPKELNNLGEKLHWLQARLLVLEQQKLRLIRQMSHELKTPLASLREGADLLSEELLGQLNDSQREIVEILQDKGLQLQHIIENLLDYNALMYQRGILVSQFDLRKLIDEVLHEYRLDIQKKYLYYCLDGQSQTLCADQIKLRTLLSNLISNAIYYSTHPARMWISWQVTDNKLTLQIANHGIAIPCEDKQRIFLPFEQGKQPRTGTIKGSGIGLSVALECALLHGGTLELGTHPQAEVCFQLQLPLQQVPNSNSAHVTSQHTLGKLSVDDSSSDSMNNDINNTQPISQHTRIEGL